MPNSDQLFTPNQSSSCPVTGLPITTRPGWTEIQLKSGFSVTFNIIGNAILLTTPKGDPSEEGAKALLEKRAEVIKEAGLADRNYVELRDYRMLSGAAPKGARMALTNFLLKEGSGGHLKGFWVYGAPFHIRLMFQAGLRLLKPPIPVGVAKDYGEAIQDALKVLRQQGVDVGSRLYPRLKKDGWELEIEEYGISFELIGDDILYTIARGRQKEAHVEKFFALHEKVLHEAGLTQKGYYYRIINWERFESIAWKARLMYMAGLKALNKKTPCRLSVIFGLNKFMKALVVINKPFVSIPVIVAQDLENALEIIEREREQETGAGPVRKTQKLEAKTYTEEQLKGFANEMLQVIGGINWDQAGISLDGLNEKHPLKPVLDALAIVKLDLDNLIQEKEGSQKSLHESEKRYRSLVENASDMVFRTDVNGHFTFVNPALLRITGYEEAEIIGKQYTIFIRPDMRDEALKFFGRQLVKGLQNTYSEYPILTKDGHGAWVGQNAQLIVEDGNVTGFQVVARDITERKRAEETLKESENRYRDLSIIDDLTQLYNSRHFYDQLKMEIDRVDRYGQPLTLLLLDLDDFKRFNDEYGHVEGDQVLMRLGQVVKRCLRRTDSAYRYGGEEFTIIMPMTTSEEGAVTAERIRTEFKKETFSPAPGQDVHVTVSIGLAQYKPQEEMKAFVHRVDQLMYQGKKNGKDRVCSES